MSATVKRINGEFQCVLVGPGGEMVLSRGKTGKAIDKVYDMADYINNFDGGKARVESSTNEGKRFYAVMFGLTYILATTNANKAFEYADRVNAVLAPPVQVERIVDGLRVEPEHGPLPDEQQF